MSDHLSSKHHGARPFLLIRGFEPGRESTIRRRLHLDDLVIGNCTTARIELNGLPPQEADPAEILKILSSRVDADINLDLVNRFDTVAEPASESYRLLVRIPDKTSLDAVDRVFIDHLATNKPSMSHVASFLNDPHCGGVVGDYAGALGSYVRGLLVKDQAIGTGVTLPAAEADNLYGHALGVLQDFHRPLPVVICGLARFAANDFSLAGSPTGFNRLDRCNALLASLLGLQVEMNANTRVSDPGGTVGLCPVDHAIDRILDLAARLDRQTRWGPVVHEDCLQAAEATMITARDRTKVHALWAMYALRLGATDAAREPLRWLRGIYPFHRWAAEQLDRLGE